MLTFRLVQLENEDLNKLLVLVTQLHKDDPEMWGQILENLETARDTNIEWADWDMPDEDVRDSSIALIRWSGETKWQMGLPVPSSLAHLLAMKV